MRALWVLCLLSPLLSWAQSSQTQIDSLFREVDRARAASDTMRWIQTLDALVDVYEGKQKRGSPIKINLNGEETRDPQAVSVADSLEALSTQRDTIWAWYGFDLSRPLTDSSGLYEVPYRRLGGHYWAWPDSLGEWPLDSVLDHPELAQLQAFPAVGKAGRWVRVRLRNHRDQARLVYLQIEAEGQSEGTWEQVRLYQPLPAGGFRIDTTGWAADLPGKHLREPGPFLPLMLPAQSDQPYYLWVGPRLSPIGGNSLQLTQIDFPALMEAEQRLDNYSGLFLGVLLIQAVYYLLLFGATRDRSYLFYVIFLAGLIMFALTFGYLADWMPGAQLAQIGLSILGMLTCYYGLLFFSYHFLSTDTYRPLSKRWRRILVWSMPGALFIPFLIIILIGVSGIESGGPIAGVIAVGMVILVMLLFFGNLFFVIVMGWRSLKKGYQPAQAFMLSQTTLLLGVLIPASVSIYGGFFDLPDWLHARAMVNIICGGVVLQLALMALGIGQKRRLLERDKLEAEQRLTEELKRQNEAFSRFVPHEFLQAIGRDTILDVALGDGVEREVTVLFSDIRGYTSLSEEMTPDQTFHFLNQYLGKVGPVVREHFGFVNQFYGDGIMALFIQSPEHAVKAAIGMQQAIAAFNQERAQAQEAKPIRVGIGLHSGRLMMGVIGESNRFDAGVVADAVNTAARMEGLTKYYGASLLVSEPVWDRIADHSQFAHRFIARVQVKGRKQPLAVYDVFDADSREICQLKQKTLADFNQAVQAFQARQFSAAAVGFEAVLQVNPADLAAERYLSYARRFLHEGIPEDWDGVERMKEK